MKSIDPYRMLALGIVGRGSWALIDSVLNDDQFVYRLVREECRNLDLQGLFLDALVEDTLTNEGTMVIRRSLDELADKLFQKLDLSRLRREISRIISRM